MSPLLANIYLDQLDKFVEEVIVPKYETNASKRRYNPPYYKIGASIAKLTKKIDQLEKGNKEREELIKQIKSLKLSRRGLKTLDPMDENFVRIKYVRYADDFVIGVIGSKQLAQQIKQEVAEFLQNTLKLNLSDEKTLITNFGSKTKPVKFLGYEIYSGAANDYIVKKKNGHVTRAINEIPRLRLSGEVITGRLNQITKNGKPIHRAELIPYDLAETIAKYSAEIRGLYNYYRLADNVAYQLNRYRWYHRTSLLKTIAAKMKISCQVARRKYNVNGTIGYIIQREPKKHNIIVKYYDEGFQKDDYVEKANENPDNISIMVRRTGRNGVIKRLLALECEQCGYTGNNVTYEVHHVRKLKDLKKMYKGKNMPPKWVQVMIARNRKTMVLCKPCHDQIHSVGR